MGQMLSHQGKYDEAVNAFDRAIELFPRFVIAWYGKGDALRALGRNAEAMTAFAKPKELGYDG